MPVLKRRGAAAAAVVVVVVLALRANVEGTLLVNVDGMLRV